MAGSEFELQVKNVKEMTSFKKMSSLIFLTILSLKRNFIFILLQPDIECLKRWI
jgi:hypothetical protein